jgi:hypothetical protein
LVVPTSSATIRSWVATSTRLRNTMTDAEEERLVDRIVVDHGTLPVEGLYRALKGAGAERRQRSLHSLKAS